MPILQKILNEGTQSPFIARLFSWMLTMRDILIQQDSLSTDPHNIKDHFDKYFEPLRQSLINQRNSARNIIALIQEHNNKLANNQLITYINGGISINYNIDNLINTEIKSFIINGNIAIKSNLQKLLKKLFDLDIGYLFQEDKNFNNGIQRLRTENDSSIADYLMQTRKIWLKSFVSIRNDIEHNGYEIQKIKYQQIYNSFVSVEYPILLGFSLDEFVRTYHNHVCLVTEDLMAYAFTRIITLPIFLSEIPYHFRNPSNCERFSVEAIGLSNKLKWEIRYSETSDFL